MSKDRAYDTILEEMVGGIINFCQKSQSENEKKGVTIIFG